MRNTWWAKLLRIIAIVLMSLTAVFTLMGGAGTSCVALNPTGYDGKFSGIAPFQWLWILFVLVGLAAGIMGFYADGLLIKGAKTAYKNALIALLLGTVLNAIHMIASRSLRGSSMPVDAVLYTNVLTLLVFLFLRIPGIWQGVNFEKPAGDKPTDNLAAAIALGAAGLLTLTIQFLMASTHTIGGVNYADAWQVSMTIIGGGLLLGGISTSLLTRLTARRRQALPEVAKT